MYFKWFQSTNTDPSFHKNFLKEKRQSGNFEASTSDESRNKSLTSSPGKHPGKHGFQTMWDSFLERWVFIRSLSVGYFLREKIREIRPQKTSGLGGWHPCRHFTKYPRPAFRRDAEFGDHFSHDLSLNARRAHMSIRRRRIRSHAWRTTQKQPHFLNTNHD